METINLSDQHPSIKTVHCHFRFVDPDAMADTIERNGTWGPTQESPWIMKCPYRECINGGFDLGPVLSDAASKNETEVNGMVACQGWQDRERIGKHQCLCELIYNLQIEYF